MLARIFDGKCARTLRAAALVAILERGIRPSTNSGGSHFASREKKTDLVTGFAVFPCTQLGNTLLASVSFGDLPWVSYILTSNRAVHGAAAIQFANPGEGELWKEWRVRFCKSFHTGARRAITGTSSGALQIAAACIGPPSLWACRHAG